MTLVPVFGLPGINKSTSDYSASKQSGGINARVAQGRYIDGNKVRFVAGFPEKVGGCLSAGVTMTGVPRVMREWRGVDGTVRTMIGTSKKLYVYDGSSLTDVTPFRLLGNCNFSGGGISTVNGTSIITFSNGADPSPSPLMIPAVGEWFYLSRTTAVAGITFGGYYQVASVSITSGVIFSFTFDCGVLANATVVSVAYGVLTVYASRLLLPAGGVATTNGSPLVVISVGFPVVGELVNLGGLTAVGGITLSGDYVVTAIGVGSFTINAGSNANATTTGGGSNGYIAIYLGPQAYSTTGSGNFAYTKTLGEFWTLAPYGSQMLACPMRSDDGTTANQLRMSNIQVWDPTLGGRTKPLLNAPDGVLAVFVTHERFVVALGQGTFTPLNGNSGVTEKPLTLAWPDQIDYTNWTPATTNTANSGRTVQGGSFFINGLPVRDGVSLAFTNHSVFQLTYSGDTYVYDLVTIADRVGLIGPGAVVTEGGVAYWMSDADFWTWNGTVQSLPSDDIRDYVYLNINKSYAWKSFAGFNRGKKEIWFFYPTGANTECDSYVIYHIDQGCWDIGTWGRTAWTDRELLNYPLAGDSGGLLYTHETGHDDNGNAMDAYITFADADVSNGDRNMDIFGFVPDFQRQTGNVSLTVLTRTYPQDSNTSDGPYTIADNASTPRIDLRSAGKLMGWKLESNVLGGDFRIGVVRVEAQPSGARR